VWLWLWCNRTMGGLKDDQVLKDERCSVKTKKKRQRQR